VKTCTKTYVDIPFAHRAPFHDGHCALIHGHNWSFEITFIAREADANGFIVDFGKLQPLKENLMAMFDHKLVLNDNDPLAEKLIAFTAKWHISNIVRLPDCSCEGIAKFVFNLADGWVRLITDDRARALRVVVHEDAKNFASYGAIAEG
jgi:6-pyruvoyltetrahydropterin/6-carboxytetrahydropterin synthase